MTPASIPTLPGPADHALFTDEAGRSFLETEIFPGYVTTARWFGGKARAPRTWKIRDVIPASARPDAARLLFLEIEYPDGGSETYLLPLQIAGAGSVAHLPASGIVARFADGAVLFDALHDSTFRESLFQLMLGGASFSGADGEVAGVPGSILREHRAAPVSRVLGVEQSNSSIIYGDAIFLKLYRRLEEGVNPDAEILRFLGERQFAHVPPFGGAIEYRARHGGVRVLALALGMVPNDGDAWSFTLRHLGDFYARLLAGDRAAADQLHTEYLTAVAQLGTRTGELHRALAAATGDPDFTPEPFAVSDASALGAALQKAVPEVCRLLAERRDVLDPGTRELAERLRESEAALLARADALATFSTSAMKTRTHGDYHLGQVLHGPGGFVIIDFEGEPMASLAARRRKMSPFRDVAGMLRSFHYAAHAALEPLAVHRARLAGDAEVWAQRAQQIFLEAWMAATDGAVFRDPDPVAERVFLNAFLLEKALYEVRYEANNRPAWLSIPLRGVLGL